ncbi:hypothetical protein CDAR_311781 [Caerostris darwini]|uniref:Uncharacterized protein n=1 Tax=Caerostris darwini TaxID=1538125 RepID=A0AAV4TNN7_9ARAC|nr:hypothetical protein CDAR_311781 [Caerostris darwini]
MKKEEKSLPEGKKVASADVTDKQGETSPGRRKTAISFLPPANFLVERSSNGYAKQAPFEYPPQVHADQKRTHNKAMEHSKEQRENNGFIYLFMKKKKKKSLPEGKKVASADVTDNKEKQVQEEEKQLFLFFPQR